MVWKLKKSNATDDEAAQPNVNLAPQSAMAADSVDFETNVGPSEAMFDADAQHVQDSNEFYAERLSAVDQAIAALTNSKKLTQPESGSSDTPAAPATPQAPAPAAHSEEEEDWSLDAFAPYKPPEGFQAPGTQASNGGSNGSAAPVEAESLHNDIEFSPGLGTDTSTHEPEPLEFGTIDLNPITAGETPERTLDFSQHAEPQVVDNTEWQLGEAGTIDRTEALGESEEPLIGNAEPLEITSTLGNGTGVAEQHDNFSLNSLPTLDGESVIDRTLPYGEGSDAIVAPPAPEPVTQPVAPVASVAEPSVAEPDIAPPPVAQPAPAAAPAPPPPPLSEPRLTVRLGQFAANYPLTPSSEMIIGRPDPKTGAVPEIAIEWDDAISRRHAQVYFEDGFYMVVDLASKNGTYLNDNLLPQNKPVPLKNGDKIRLGERTEITFEQ